MFQDPYSLTYSVQCSCDNQNICTPESPVPFLSPASTDGLSLLRSEEDAVQHT